MTPWGIPMRDPAIRVRGLRVEYGEVTAVRDLDLDVESGMIYGLIGPNGAGKTSTIRVLATLLEPSRGEAAVHGVDLQDRPREARRLFGYMPDASPVYDDLTAREFLDFYAMAYRYPRLDRPRRIAECLALTRLEEKTDALAGGLSRGMKQRLVLAKTLLHDPPVLLLDEPASGLDPLARIEFRAILRDLGAAGKAVLISSHILTELSDFCNAIGIMERGRMVVSGRIDDILARLSPHTEVEILLAAPDDRLAPILSAHPRVKSYRVDGASARIRFDGDGDALAALLRQLVEAGLAVRRFADRRENVEDIFMKVGAHAVS
jgi:ABC-2 type transport system ATP-binding protein